MKWLVRRSDGNDTVIDSADYGMSTDGYLTFERSGVEIAIFHPAGWLWAIRQNLENPVEVGLQTLSKEFTP